MLKCVFQKRGIGFSGFTISGHAGYGTEGNDIVCAAVSSCVMLTCNAITDFFKADADVEVSKNGIRLALNEKNESAERLLWALYDHILYIAEDHPKVKVTVLGGKNDD
ncbi:MAG: ribosomal-processing cysteine protease Prp [Oscillospiraceae bacterium]|nr:ribosomal-processing cysteine protease Prp [Oscillospiraceae bacterium]MCH5208605.1 ribosomal-processing cysteine protease Prp [Oscillospiraceae bacterium]